MELVETSTTRNEEVLKLKVIPPLELKRLWNCYIKPYVCRNMSIVEGAVELSELIYSSSIFATMFT